MNGKNIEENNLTFLLMCYMLKMDIFPAYASKHNSNGEKQVILLMIPNGE